MLNKDHLPSGLDNPALKKALNVLEVMNFMDEEREAYESHLKWLRIEANTLKKYFNEGRAEGQTEGRTEKAIEIAKELYKQGMPIEQICKVTGLSEKDFIGAFA